MIQKTKEIKQAETEYSELTYYHAARGALAVARNIDEVKAIRDKARQIQACAMIAKDTQLVAHSVEIKRRAERLLGQKMEEEKEQRAEPGRPRKGFSENPLPTLADAGVDKNLANRARKEAAMGDGEFEESIVEGSNRILAKAAKPVVAPRQRKDAAHLKLGTSSARRQASADLAALFRVTGLDEQRIALEEAGLTDRRLLTMAPGGGDDTEMIDYTLVEVLKSQQGIDELYMALEAYDVETFKWAIWAILDLAYERLGEEKLTELLKGRV